MKNNKINLIKFNMDKSIQVKKREVDQGIIVDDKEGFIARNGAFVEFLPDKIFGFIKSTKEKTQAAYIVRENAPDPLEFNKESLYGPEFTPDDLIYKEDEFFTRSTSEIELKGSNAPDMVQKAMVYAVLGEVVAILILVLAVGVPEVLKRFTGG